MSDVATMEWQTYIPGPGEPLTTSATYRLMMGEPIEIWRPEWSVPRVVRYDDLHAALNVAGLLWRSVEETP